MHWWKRHFCELWKPELDNLPVVEGVSYEEFRKHGGTTGDLEILDWPEKHLIYLREKGIVIIDFLEDEIYGPATQRAVQSLAGENGDLNRFLAKIALGR